MRSRHYKAEGLGLGLGRVNLVPGFNFPSCQGCLINVTDGFTVSAPIDKGYIIGYITSSAS